MLPILPGPFALQGRRHSEGHLEKAIGAFCLVDKPSRASRDTNLRERILTARKAMRSQPAGCSQTSASNW